MIRSPWRYPGGKARLCPTLLELVPTDITSYWEPFVGGGALALAVMERAHLDHRRLKVVLNDGDPRVSSWWSLVTGPAQEEFNDLLLMLQTVQPTVDIFRKLQALGLEAGGTLLFSAYAGIFLNRCAYSGILSAGPIGGDHQRSSYTVDCRFNADQLCTQHRDINSLAQHHTVATFNADFRDLLTRRRRGPRISPDTFMYVDPPYYKIGTRMYPASFTPDDHEWLANFLTGPSPHRPRRWLLSYDDHPWVRETYGLAGCVIKSVDTAYTSRTKNPDEMATSELMITPPV